MEYADFETPSTVSYTNKIESKNNWTTLGLCSAESLRGKNIFKISKRRITAPEIETPSIVSYTNKA